MTVRKPLVKTAFGPPRELDRTESLAIQWDWIVDVPPVVAPSWGTITGTLSDQTDLQTALDGKAPLTGTGTSGTWPISITGNSATTTKLATARLIGGVSFDGTVNINLPGVNSTGNQDTTGNAATATVLQTARTINGTSFNGSANITTASWGTARTLTVGSTGKSVNGGGNVAWSLAEIGAAAASHTHVIGDVTNLQTSLDAKANLSGATFTGKVFVGNSIESTGTSAELVFQDRTTARRWLWYGTSDTAHFYNGATNILTITPTGAFNAAGAITQAGSQVWHAGNFNPATKLDHRENLRGYAETVSDWNNAAENGWYMASGATNAPTAGSWYVGRVTVHNSSWITQEAWRFTEGTAGVATPVYRRSKVNGTWGGWSSNIYTDGHVQAGSRFYVREGADTSNPVGAGRIFGAYYLPSIYDGSVLLSYDYTAAAYKPMKIEVSGFSVNTGATPRFEVSNDNDGAFTSHGRGRFRHTGGTVTAGAWYYDSANNKKFFVGLFSDSEWGVYASNTSWKWFVGDDGRTAIKNANSGTMTTQPRIFVQSSDPGAAAADGDLWFW